MDQAWWHRPTQDFEAIEGLSMQGLTGLLDPIQPGLRYCLKIKSYKLQTRQNNLKKRVKIKSENGVCVGVGGLGK